MKVPEEFARRIASPSFVERTYSLFLRIAEAYQKGEAVLWDPSCGATELSALISNGLVEVEPLIKQTRIRLKLPAGLELYSRIASQLGQTSAKSGPGQWAGK